MHIARDCIMHNSTTWRHARSSADQAKKLVDMSASVLWSVMSQ